MTPPPGGHQSGLDIEKPKKVTTSSSPDRRAPVEIRQALIEGYRANAAQAQQVAEEFANVEAELP